MPKAACCGLSGLVLQQMHHPRRVQVPKDLLYDAGRYWWVARAAVAARVPRRSALEMGESELASTSSPLWLCHSASTHIICRELISDSGWGKNGACGWPVYIGRTSTGPK